MAVRDSATEELIKETARNLFFAEGKFHATTQEIAEAAGVNRTLVHYYFRSRDYLFEQVLQEAMVRIEQRAEAFLTSGLSFRQKIEKYIDEFTEQSLRYPYLDTYVVSKMNESLEHMTTLFKDASRREKQRVFLAMAAEAIERGEVRATDPFQFYLNLFSLLAHPIALQPIFKKAFNVSDKKYEKLIRDRKVSIINLLFN